LSVQQLLQGFVVVEYFEVYGVLPKQHVLIHVHVKLGGIQPYRDGGCETIPLPSTNSSYSLNIKPLHDGGAITKDIRNLLVNLMFNMLNISPHFQTVSGRPWLDTAWGFIWWDLFGLNERFQFRIP